MNLKKTINDHNFFDKDLDKLLQESKVVINFHSTTSLDSIYHLTPVINLSLDKKVNWFYQIPYYKFVLNFKVNQFSSFL